MSGLISLESMTYAVREATERLGPSITRAPVARLEHLSWPAKNLNTGIFIPRITSSGKYLRNSSMQLSFLPKHLGSLTWEAMLVSRLCISL